MNTNISKRNFIKIGGIGIGSLALRGAGVGALGGLALSSAGCDIKQADIVVDSLEESLPIIRDLLPASAEIVVRAITVAKKLRDAIKANDGTALGFLKQLIAPNGLINQIVDTLALIHDDNQRRILSGILLLANIALRAISTKLQSNVPVGAQAAASGKDPEAVAAVNKAAASVEPALAGLRF